MSKYLRAMLWAVEDYVLMARCALRGHRVSLLCGSGEEGNHPIEKCRCGKRYISYPVCGGHHYHRLKYDFPIEDLLVE